MSAKSFAVDIDDVQGAAKRIVGQVLRTPIIPAPRLSELTGAEIFVKYENLQATNSFKDRGALVKLLSLTAAQRARGVIAMSAGNHAQSVAYHARRLGIPSLIVMPETTPYVKVGNTEALGAEVVLAGAALADAGAKAEEIAGARQLTMVHPYDDPLVIAGQGTIALEVLADQPDLDTLVIPVGGGGLISGNAISAKALNPEIEIIGVEAALYPSMYRLLRGETGAYGDQTLADGIAVKTPGKLTAPVVEALVSDIILVDELALERAVFLFLTLQKTMAEGAGAAGLAALLTDPDRFSGKRVCLYLSGGNVDPRVLAWIMLRGLERNDKIIAVRVIIPDRPGLLGAVTSLIGAERANILEVSHRHMLLDVPPKTAALDFLIETKDEVHSARVIERLKGEGYEVMRLKGPGGATIDEVLAQSD